MKNQENRDIMTKLYRVVERYENAPTGLSYEEQGKYFTEVFGALNEIFNAYRENEIARHLCVGLYTALEERFKKANP